MHAFRLLRRWRRPATLAALVMAGSGALAAPFSTTYTGTISTSDFPEVTAGETYTVTLVFDNGGASANSQTWAAANLSCAIWRMNNARNVVFTQNLVATPPLVVSGSAATSAAGALTSMFSAVSAEPGGAGFPAGSYTASGIALTAPVHWFANGANGVFYDALGGPQARLFRDAAGGVQMGVANWSAPVPFTGACAAGPTPPASVAAVPALGEWSLALMALAAAGLGARRLRRRG